MAILKCKMCGGTLEINSDETISTCEYCGTEQTIPKITDDILGNLFNRANTLRMKSEFDKAEEIYSKIIEIDNTQAEAYWGIILCKYGIEYVEDPKTLKRVPTCHRSSFDAITADEDYRFAIKYADIGQKTIYETEAKAIDEIQKGILAISQNEEPYDVFISYKETDENGNRTFDSVLANDIYHQLTQEGFKVFYAAITLEDKLGQEYEPYIFAAINSSKVMISIGSKPEYFSAVWVKNEWSRFMKLMKNDRSKLLIPCYKDMDAYELPEEFAHLQAQDMSKIGFINDILRGIKKVIKKDEGKTADNGNDVQQNNMSVSNVAPLLKRAFMFIEDEEWDSAEEYAERVLDINPECGDAYVAKLMVECKIKSFDVEFGLKEDITKTKNYSKVMKYAHKDVQTKINNNFRRDFADIFRIVNGKLQRIDIHSDASELSVFKIPNSVTSIGEYAFYKCSNLIQIKIPNSVTSIGDCAFTECSSLTQIEIPNSVTSIGGWAFSECSSLRQIEIPNSITSIGDWAFLECSGLTQIEIPNSVTFIGEGAFSNCSNLTQIIIPDGNKYYKLDRGVLYNDDLTILHTFFPFNGDISEFAIPNSVTSIGDSAFYNCSNLTQIKIPNSVTSIGDSAFYNCSNLTQIEIPNSVISIGDSAFSDCSSLTQIEIPNSVTSIGESAFSRCSNLTQIEIPNSVTSIGRWAFSGCSSLTQIIIPDKLKNIAKKDMGVEKAEIITWSEKSIIEQRKKEEKIRQEQQKEEEKIRQEQQKEEEKRFQEQQNKLDRMKEYRNNGRCQYCGAAFKGLIIKKCSFCRVKKDY
ncbi:MAG: leucine-rich repeat protein [Lachnospiraceae bacterium]|nr:leucine-rich repeat protein [Lachnospiraceae bacterium]